MSNRSKAVRWAVMACLAACGVARTAGPATRPTLTRHDGFKSKLAFNRHTLVDAYDADAAHDPKWDADAHAFFERLAVRVTEADADQCYLSGVPTDTATMPKLLAPLDRCDDPLVGYWRASAGGEAVGDDAASRLWSKHVLGGPLARRL